MKKNTLIFTSIICLTVIVLSSIGAFLFINVRNSQQQKKLAEFEKQQNALKQTIDRECALVDRSIGAGMYYREYKEVKDIGTCDYAKKQLEELKP